MKREGPHKVCRKCDLMVDQEQCRDCKGYDWKWCNGECVRCTGAPDPSLQWPAVD